MNGRCETIGKPLRTGRMLLSLLLLLCCALAACGTAAPAQAIVAHAAKRMAPEHAVPSAAPATPALTYVALGASDAFGIGTDDPDRENWPTVLAAKLGGHVHLVNLGIPGATVATATQAELPIAIDQHPAIVTIWLAVNDIEANVPLNTYEQQLQSLIASLRAHTSARIFVANVPDLTLLPYFEQDDQSQLGAEVRAWNAAIAHVCAIEGVTLVDLYTNGSELASNPEYVASDGLHPSTLGAQRLAAAFAAAISAAGVHP